MNFREKEFTKKTGLIFDRKTIIASVGEKIVDKEEELGRGRSRCLEEKDHT